MKRSITTSLILKDLYLYRTLIVGAFCAGLASLALALLPGKSAAFAVGGIAFITSVVALGVFLAMFAFITERKDRSILFALSLPVSARQYARAKLGSVLVGYLIPWTTLTLIAVLCILAMPAPQGLLPYLAVVMGFFLALQVCLVAFLCAVESEALAGVGIIVLNLSISFFMMSLSVYTPITAHAKNAVADWSGVVFLILLVEAAVAVVALLIALLIQSRKRDFI